MQDATYLECSLYDVFKSLEISEQNEIHHVNMKQISAKIKQTHILHSKK